MTLQELRGKLYEQGLFKQSVESKAVTMAYGIMTGTETTAAEIAENEALLRKTKSEIQKAESGLYYRQRRFEDEKEKYLKEKAIAEKHIDEFYDALTKCETEEARDALRIAQMYANSIDVRTAYDNTAYIVGLAAILTGKKIDPELELKKINPKLPSLGRL